MSYDNPRISLNMTMQDVVIEMCEGNPGAINVLVQVIQNAADIDPDDAFGYFGTLMGLDTADIYGSNIWILYSDVCNRNLTHMLALLRAAQLGFSSDEELHQMIKAGYGVDRNRVAELVKLVRERLPAFKQTDD